MGTPVPFLSFPRCRFAYFAAMGKVGRRLQAAKSPVFSLPKTAFPRRLALFFPETCAIMTVCLGCARRKEVLV